MNYSDIALRPDDATLDVILQKAAERSRTNMTGEVYKLCYSCIDLTSLNGTDTGERITGMVDKVVGFHAQFPSIPNVASVCVYPSMVDAAGLAIGNSGIAITSVAGGFPASQTFLEVKALETAMAVENGADEIDIVLNLGLVLAGNFEAAAAEIDILKQEAGQDTILKVIIESGALADRDAIWQASMLALYAGADFIKTSTGKIPVAATPEAAAVMCCAIKEFHAATGRKAGFKAAGGVATAEDAALYYSIVETVLGPGWLTPSLFRIGASSLANNLLTAIEGRQVKYF